MSQFSETHQACESCGSSDARSTYTSGVSICFSCGVITPPAGKSAAQAKEGTLDFVFGTCKRLAARGINEDTCKRYGYQVGTWKGQGVHIAPYYDEKTGALTSQKLRTKDKKFCITGDAKNMGLFGLQLARRGGKMIVITEGEIDAMSVSQAMGNTWPAVSLPSGAQNLQALKDKLEFLETYEKVVLCFDSDNPGQLATTAALELFSPGKAYTTDLSGTKDANELLLSDPKALRTAIWEAKEYRPDGIVDLVDMYDEISKPLVAGLMTPWAKLNDLTYGIRDGEMWTWTAGTGVGKTAIISELEYHLVKCKQRIGIIHLEEGCARSGRRMVGIELNRPIHLPGNEVSKGDFDMAFAATIGTGLVHAYNHFGSLDADLLLGRIRYLVKAKGCTQIILDHVSMVVSGSDLAADERRMLDRTMTMLKSLTEETGCTIHVISHLSRQQGSGSHEEGAQVSLSHLRGTQSIAQLSDFVIAAERNQQADTERGRNTTLLRVLKNRYAGLTGPADYLLYVRETGRLQTTTPEENTVDMGEGKSDF